MQVDGEVVPRKVRVVLLAKRRPLIYYVMSGAVVCSKSPVYFFNNDHQAALLSLRTRVLGCYINGVPVPNIVVAPQAYRVDSFTRFLFSSASLVTPLSLEQSCSRFKGPRRRVYQKKLGELQAMGLGGSDYPCGRTFVLQNHIKNEPYAKSTAHPRMIRAYDPAVNIVFGTISYGLTAVLKDAINSYVSDKFDFPAPILLSGTNRDVQARTIMRSYEALCARTNEPIVIIQLDGNRYDYHVGREAMEWTHKIYQCAPSDYKNQLRDYFRSRERKEKNVIRTNDALITYFSKPQRASGSNDTWLGNTLIACKMIVAVCDLLWRNGCRVMQSFDNSDDIRFLLPKSFLQMFSDAFTRIALEHGFRFEVEAVTEDPRRFLWMQSHLYYDGQKFQLVRDIRRAMTRDMCSARNFADKDYYYGWLAAVGYGGLITFGNVPILSAMYDCMWRNSRGYVPLVDAFNEYSWGYEANRELEDYGLMLKRVPTKQRETVFSTKFAESRKYRLDPPLHLRSAVWEVEDFVIGEQLYWERHFDQLDLVWSKPVDGTPDGPTLF